MQRDPHPGASWRGNLFLGMASPEVIWWNPKIASNYCSSPWSTAAAGDRVCTGLDVHKKLIFCLAGEKRESCSLAET